MIYTPELVEEKDLCRKRWSYKKEEFVEGRRRRWWWRTCRWRWSCEDEEDREQRKKELVSW